MTEGSTRNRESWTSYWALVCISLAVVIRMNSSSQAASLIFGFLGATLIIAFQQVWIEFVTRLFRKSLGSMRIPLHDYLIYISVGVLIYVAALAICLALNWNVGQFRVRILLAPVMFLGTFGAIRAFRKPHSTTAERI